MLFISHNIPLQNYDLAFDRYEQTLDKKFPKEELKGFCDSVLDEVLKNAETDFIRKVYSYTLAKIPSSCSYYLKITNWESTAHVEIDVLRIRRIYREAIDRHGNSEPDLWLKFIEFETSNHELTNAGTLFWEAKKSLTPEHLQNFLYSHTVWQNSQNSTVNDVMDE